MSESEGWLGAAGGTGERGLRAMRGCPGAPSEMRPRYAATMRMGRVRERATPDPGTGPAAASRALSLRCEEKLSHHSSVGAGADHADPDARELGAEDVLAVSG